MTSTRSDAAEAMREVCAEVADAFYLKWAQERAGHEYSASTLMTECEDIADKIRALPVPATVESGETALQSYIRTGQPLFQSKVEREEYERSIGYVGPSDTPALEQAEPVGYMRAHGLRALNGIGLTTIYNAKHKLEDDIAIYAHPQAVDAESLPGSSRDETYAQGVADADQLIGCLWVDLFNKDLVKASGADYFDKWRDRIRALKSGVAK
jgi:hypothetical protein